MNSAAPTPMPTRAAMTPWEVVARAPSPEAAAHTGRPPT